MITLDKMDGRIQRIEALLFSSPEFIADLQRQEVVQQSIDRLGLILGALDKLMQSHAALDKRFDLQSKIIDHFCERLSAIEGKLDGIRDGLATEIGDSRESAMRNHVQVMAGLKALIPRKKGKRR